MAVDLSTEEELEKIRANLLQQLKQEDEKTVEQSNASKSETANDFQPIAVSDGEMDELPVGADAQSLNPPPTGKTLNVYLKTQSHEVSLPQFHSISPRPNFFIVIRTAIRCSDFRSNRGG